MSMRRMRRTRMREMDGKVRLKFHMGEGSRVVRYGEGNQKKEEEEEEEEVWWDKGCLVSV